MATQPDPAPTKLGSTLLDLRRSREDYVAAEKLFLEDENDQNDKRLSEISKDIERLESRARLIIHQATGVAYVHIQDANL